MGVQKGEQGTKGNQFRMYQDASVAEVAPNEYLLRLEFKV